MGNLKEATSKILNEILDDGERRHNTLIRKFMIALEKAEQMAGNRPVKEYPKGCYTETGELIDPGEGHRLLKIGEEVKVYDQRIGRHKWKSAAKNDGLTLTSEDGAYRRKLVITNEDILKGRNLAMSIIINDQKQGYKKNIGKMQEVLERRNKQVKELTAKLHEIVGKKPEDEAICPKCGRNPFPGSSL